jgi:hypothetical protein
MKTRPKKKVVFVGRYLQCIRVAKDLGYTSETCDLRIAGKAEALEGYYPDIVFFTEDWEKFCGEPDTEQIKCMISHRFNANPKMKIKEVTRL